jgi:probable phosphoglycerate mutase
LGAAVIPADLIATLVLVRHGESTWITEGRFQGRQNPPLSQLGERQAGLVGRRLAERDLETPLPIPTGIPVGVWHSPLERAAATARQIARSQPEGVPTVPTETLIELAQGEWEGQPHGVVSTRWAVELAAWRRAPARSHAPGGESLLDAQQRVAAGIAQILDEMPRLESEGSMGSYSPVPGYPGGIGQSVLSDPWAVLVAHDGVFRVLLLTLLDVPLERFWSFPFNLCAITVVALRDGVATLRAHNLSEHLAPLAAEARAAAEARGDRRGAL